MAKHTYGFPNTTDRAQAIAEAVDKAREDGFIPDGSSYSTQVLETEAHKAEGEMCVVVRSAN